MRRRFLQGALATGVAAPALGGCSSATEQAAARALRRPLAVDKDARAGGAMPLRELVRAATLAPSSHNTQCWTFALQPQAVVIAPDLSRRCPVVDPDDHHLWVSLGCATENLAQAALAAGLKAEARFDEAGAGAIAVSLSATRAAHTSLYEAITERQCTRSEYDGHPLKPGEWRLLEAAGTGPGVRVLMLTERRAMETVLDHVTAGNAAQLGNPAFMAELKAWVRFSAAEAQRLGDGLFAGASGNPAVPRWLGSRAMDLLLTPASENDRHARQVRSSAGIAVFVADSSDPAHWVEVGRCAQRFALQATAMGLRHAHLNQPVEVARIRQQFAQALGLGAQRPDLVLRIGRGPAMPWSMRRPVEAVLV